MNVGQIVIITDIDMIGVVTRINAYSDMTVYQVTTLTGTKWAREASDLTAASEAAAATFVNDVKILAPTTPDLADAFAQVITPMDTVVPGVRLVDIKLSTTMPSGNVITRREVAAEMIRTAASASRPFASGLGPRVRSVTEMI